MGLKSYFRKPASKDAQLPEIEEPSASGTFTPAAWTSHTPMSQESSDHGIAMHRLNDARCELMVNHIWSQQAKLLWNSGEEDEGVVIKQRRGQYVCCPPDLCRPDGFYDAIQALNVKVCTYILVGDTYIDWSSECPDNQHPSDPSSRPKLRSNFYPNQ
jgi:hypothetical protein